MEMAREIDEGDVCTCCKHRADVGCRRGSCAEGVRRVVTCRDEERQIMRRIFPCQGTAEHCNFLACRHIVRNGHKRENHIRHIRTRIAQRNLRLCAARCTQLIHGKTREHRECNLIRTVHDHRPIRGDIFFPHQGGEFRFF